MSELQTLTMDQVTQPINPPDGTWLATILSGKTKPGRGDNGPEKRYLFALSMLAPEKDVSQAEIDARGSIADYNTVYYEIPHFDKRAYWYLKKFALASGLSEASMEGVTPEAIPGLLKNHQILITGQETHEEGRDPRWVVSSYAAAV